MALISFGFLINLYVTARKNFKYLLVGSMATYQYLPVVE